MITIRLSEAEIAASGACKRTEANSARHWTTLLRAVIAEQNDLRARRGRRPLPHLRVRWTALHSLWLAVAIPEYYAWAVTHGLLPGAIYLTGANLTGAYLTGAYLTGAYLTGANLTGAYLTGAYLTGANLTGANLTGAYLTGADLTGAYLTGADLTGAYRGSSPAPDGWVVDVHGFLQRKP